MGGVIFVLTGVCLIAMGLAAKVPAAGESRSARNAAREKEQDRGGLPARRTIMMACGMAAMLYGLYRLGR